MMPALRDLGRTLHPSFFGSLFATRNTPPTEINTPLPKPPQLNLGDYLYALNTADLRSLEGRPIVVHFPRRPERHELHEVYFGILEKNMFDDEYKFTKRVPRDAENGGPMIITNATIFASDITPPEPWTSAHATLFELPNKTFLFDGASFTHCASGTGVEYTSLDKKLRSVGL